jgi:hypothetical protein
MLGGTALPHLVHAIADAPGVVVNAPLLGAGAASAFGG